MSRALRFTRATVWRSEPAGIQVVADHVAVALTVNGAPVLGLRAHREPPGLVVVDEAIVIRVGPDGPAQKKTSRAMVRVLCERFELKTNQGTLALGAVLLSAWDAHLVAFAAAERDGLGAAPGVLQ